MMSTAGGAAGLTLTVATTAFILEPSLNPGVESQAAARIWRLGQVGGGRLRPPARLLPACAVVSDPGSE
jgi:E3 ubiquitin-protein ligase SHPRH